MVVHKIAFVHEFQYHTRKKGTSQIYVTILGKLQWHSLASRRLQNRLVMNAVSDPLYSCGH